MHLYSFDFFRILLRKKKAYINRMQSVFLFLLDGAEAKDLHVLLQLGVELTWQGALSGAESLVHRVRILKKPIAFTT